MADTAQITVPEYVKKVFENYGKKHDLSLQEAAQRVVGVAVSRLNALKKYAEKGGAPKKEKAAKKVSKKAKGPIARKAKKAAAA